MQEIKKVVVLGPESTGKSTLCVQLAEHYHTIWCKEYARQYLLEHGTHYSYDDLLVIAKGQLELEEESIKNVQRGKHTGKHASESENPAGQETFHDGESNLPTPARLLFIDTNMYVMKVWCEFVFGKCHPFILDELADRKYDLYLLCNVDLPWVKDELREYPDLLTREELYHIYREIMVNQQVPWADVNGSDSKRRQVAIDAINGVFGLQV